MVITAAVLLNPWPGTYWALFAGLVPLAIAAMHEEMRQWRERRLAGVSGRVEKFQQGLRFNSRISSPPPRRGISDA